MHFCYYQLRHAAQSQFPSPSILEINLIVEFLSQDPISKHLYALYLALLSVESPKMDRLWEGRRVDIPTLDRESRMECFEYNFKLVISSRNKLIQTKFLLYLRGCIKSTHRDPMIVPAVIFLLVHFFTCFGPALGWCSSIWRSL